MEALALIAPGLCAETSAYHGGTGHHPLLSGPGIWNGTIQHAPVHYGDAAGWAIVLLLVIMLVAITLAILAIRIKPPGLTPEQELIEEVHRNEDAIISGSAETAGTPPPWERDPDWWR